MKNGILALLTQGPAYGLQLRNELTARTGREVPFNVGQVYATLDRLLNARLVSTSTPEPGGTALYELTTAGEETARTWLRVAEPGTRAAWDTMLFQVLLARSLPGVDSSELIDSYRQHWSDLQREESSGHDLATQARSLVAGAALTWLETVERTSDEGKPISRVRPPRGRPPTR